MIDSLIPIINIFLNIVILLIAYIWKDSLTKRNKENALIDSTIHGLNIKLEDVLKSLIDSSIRLNNLNTEIKLMARDSSKIEIILERQNEIINNIEKRVTKLEEWKNYLSEDSLKNNNK